MFGGIEIREMLFFWLFGLIFDWSINFVYWGKFNGKFLFCFDFLFFNVIILILELVTRMWL